MSSKKNLLTGLSMEDCVSYLGDQILTEEVKLEGVELVDNSIAIGVGTLKVTNKVMRGVRKHPVLCGVTGLVNVGSAVLDSRVADGAAGFLNGLSLLAVGYEAAIDKGTVEERKLRDAQNKKK